MSIDNNWREMTIGTAPNSRSYKRLVRLAHDILCGKKRAAITVERGVTAVRPQEG